MEEPWGYFEEGPWRTPTDLHGPYSRGGEIQSTPKAPGFTEQLRLL